MMSSLTLKRADQNRPFKGTIELRRPNGGGPFTLAAASSSHQLKLYRHNNVTPFATGQVSNGKLAFATTADALVISYSFPNTDMQGLEGYGSMELLSTVPGSTPVFVVPLRFCKEGTPYTIEDGEKLVIFNETVVVVCQSQRLIDATSNMGSVPYKPTAGRWMVNSANTTTLTAVAGVADRMEIAPWLCPMDMSADAVGVLVSAAVAAAGGKLVCYDSDMDGRPGALLFETAVLDFSSAGFKQDAMVQRQFNAGWLYWLGIRHSSTANVNAHQPYCSPVLSYGATPATTANKLLRRTLAFATAAPADWGYSAAEEINSSVPAIFLEVM